MLIVAAVLSMCASCGCRENTEGEYSGVEHEVVDGVVESLKVGAWQLKRVNLGIPLLSGTCCGRKWAYKWFVVLHRHAWGCISRQGLEQVYTHAYYVTSDYHSR